MRELILGCAVMIAAFSITGTSDFEEEVREHEHYCAMYRTWIERQGTAGHPNYEGRDCSTLEWWDQ